MPPRALKNVFLNPESVASGSLKPLKPVLFNWIELVSQYSRTFPNGDACYWYSERTNVGILSSAAANTPGGWVALEEFSTKKRKEGGKKGPGRCDLYLAKKDHDVSFAFEAKQAWPGVTLINGKLAAFVAKKMRLAWEDVEKLERNEATVHVATCFVVPQFSQPKQHDPKVSLYKSLEGWVEGVKKNVSFDGMAWVFPASSRGLLNPHEKLFPGICLLLQVQRRDIKTKNGR